MRRSRMWFMLRTAMGLVARIVPRVFEALATVAGGESMAGGRDRQDRAQ
jgi:hypothetical protein